MKFYPPEEKRGAVGKALVLSANLILFLSLYYLLPQVGFYHLPFIYVLGGAALALWYVIYNRGFSLHNATPEMLPDSYSREEKEAMLEEAERRMKRSRWALLILIPLIAVILVDMVVLVLPEGWLS